MFAQAGYNHMCTRYQIFFLSLILTTFFTACDYRTGRNEEEQVQTQAPEEKNNQEVDEKLIYHIFLENSGSMDGYVRGTTAFEDDIYKLLVDLSYLADTVQVNYINTKVIPYQSGIQSFINNLEPETFQKRGGNRSSSNLNQIFERVLKEVNEEEVSVLISDYIFSVGSGNTEGKLNNQKISIYNTFRSKLQQEPFATLIVKLNSEFNGYYYNKNDQPISLNGVRRPYYIWLMGKQEAINDFRSQIRLHTLEGFENTYMLTANAEVIQPFYTVMNNYNKVGNFRADRNHSSNTYVGGIQNIEPASRGMAEGQFGFSVAVDLSKIPVDEEYLTNQDNYQVNPAYSLENVKSIEEIDDINTRDLSLIEGKATHILTFIAQGKSYPDLQVALKKQTPAWIKATHTDDDTNIKSDSTQHKETFGFGYLVGGVEEAYQNIFGSNAYFSITISVKR